MISRDKAQFYQAIGNVTNQLNLELAQKLDLSDDIKRDLQARSILLSSRTNREVDF